MRMIPIIVCWNQKYTFNIGLKHPIKSIVPWVYNNMPVSIS